MSASVRIDRSWIKEHGDGASRELKMRERDAFTFTGSLGLWNISVKVLNGVPQDSLRYSRCKM
jgi:hypothetical protein